MSTCCWNWKGCVAVHESALVFFDSKFHFHHLHPSQDCSISSIWTAGTCKARSHNRIEDASFSSIASSLESLLIPGRIHQILIKARLTLTLNVWGSGLGKWTCLRRTTFLFLSIRGATTNFALSNTCKTLHWYARVMFTVYVWEIRTYGFSLLSCLVC